MHPAKAIGHHVAILVRSVRTSGTCLRNRIITHSQFLFLNPGLVVASQQAQPICTELVHLSYSAPPILNLASCFCFCSMICNSFWMIWIQRLVVVIVVPGFVHSVNWQTMVLGAFIIVLYDIMPTWMVVWGAISRKRENWLGLLGNKTFPCTFKGIT